MSSLEQRPGPTIEANWRRLVRRGEKQLWTDDDVQRLKAKVARLVKGETHGPVR